jgi:UrcA family protein
MTVNALHPALLMLAMLPTLATQTVKAEEVRRVRVSYADLNLRTTSGAEHLYQRIHTAAETVCRDLEMKDLSGRWMWKECVGDAISHAVADVDAPMLRAYYQEKKGVRVERVAVVHR